MYVILNVLEWASVSVHYLCQIFQFAFQFWRLQGKLHERSTLIKIKTAKIHLCNFSSLTFTLVLKTKLLCSAMEICLTNSFRIPSSNNCLGSTLMIPTNVLFIISIPWVNTETACVSRTTCRCEITYISIRFSANLVTESFIMCSFETLVRLCQNISLIINSFWLENKISQFQKYNDNYNTMGQMKVMCIRNLLMVWCRNYYFGIVSSMVWGKVNLHDWR